MGIIEINCTYLNLGLLLLFLCNLGSIHGYFIRFCCSLFVRCCFPTQRCSQISPASTNRAPIHHESAKCQVDLLSLPLVMGVAMCFLWEMFFKVFGSGQYLTCAQEPRWLRVAWWTRTLYTAISREVVGKSAPTIPEGIVGDCRVPPPLHASPPPPPPRPRHLRGIFRYLTRERASGIGDFDSFCTPSKNSGGVDRGIFHRGALGGTQDSSRFL